MQDERYMERIQGIYQRPQRMDASAGIDNAFVLNDSHNTQPEYYPYAVRIFELLKYLWISGLSIDQRPDEKYK